MAYAGGSDGLVAGGSSFSSAGGIPVNVWSRFTGAFLGGTYDRTGIVGIGMVGVVAGVTPQIDLGVYGLGLAGTNKSTTLATKVTTAGGGAGVYGTYLMPWDGKFGVSLLQVWGATASDSGGATGNFASRFTKIDASFSRPFHWDGVVLTPSANARWQSFHDDAFVDSSSASVPAASHEQFVLTAGLSLSRPVVVGGETVDTVTPHAQLQGSWVASQSGSPAPSSGANLLNSASLSAAASTGVDILFNGGASVSLSGGVSGIGGNEQVYNASLGFKINLH